MKYLRNITEFMYVSTQNACQLATFLIETESWNTSANSNQNMAVICKRWPLTPFTFLAPWPSRPPAMKTPPHPVPAGPLISWYKNATCSRIPPRASRASLPPRRWATTRCRLSLRPCTAPLSCSLQPLLNLSLLSLRPSLHQFVSIVSLLLNHRNPIFEPVCIFTFSSSAFAFLIEMNLSFKSLSAIWSLSPQWFYYYSYLSIVSWQYQKYSTILIIVLCLLCVTPLVCSYYSSFAPSSPFISSWWRKDCGLFTRTLVLQCATSTSSCEPQTTHVFADSRIGLLCHALCVCVAHAPPDDSWSLSHLGYLYLGTTPVMIKLDHFCLFFCAILFGSPDLMPNTKNNHSRLWAFSEWPAFGYGVDSCTLLLGNFIILTCLSPT